MFSKVHNIMVDRNAQVTGRVAEASQGWVEGDNGLPWQYGIIPGRPPSFGPSTKL